MTLNGRIQLTMSLAYQSVLDHQNVNGDLARTVAQDITNGSASNQATTLFSDYRPITNGGTDNIDLAGSLVDAFGNVVSFTKVKAIILESDAANTVDITVGNGTNPFQGPFGAVTHTLALSPGGLIVLMAPQVGWTVVAATGDILKLLAGAANVNYRIHVIGY